MRTFLSSSFPSPSLKVLVIQAAVCAHFDNIVPCSIKREICDDMLSHLAPFITRTFVPNCQFPALGYVEEYIENVIKRTQLIKREISLRYTSCLI